MATPRSVVWLTVSSRNKCPLRVAHWCPNTAGLSPWDYHKAEHSRLHAAGSPVPTSIGPVIGTESRRYTTGEQERTTREIYCLRPVSRLAVAGSEGSPCSRQADPLKADEDLMQQ